MAKSDRSSKKAAAAAKTSTTKPQSRASASGAIKRKMGGGVLPVTLLSGFLGSGKTTLLKRILENREGMKVAVIVNDMASVNIDASLISRTGSKLVASQEKMVALQNGCICCTLREDLLIEVAKLAAADQFDYLVIESTGISEPMQVAETFTFDIPPEALDNELAALKPLIKPSSSSSKQPAPASLITDAAGPEDNNQKKKKKKGSKKGEEEEEEEEMVEGKKGAVASAMHEYGACPLPSGLSLSRWAKLDTCVTVVDAARFMDDLSSIEELRDRYGSEVPPEDERSISSLLMEQIEFADVILLNKTDLLREAAAAAHVTARVDKKGTNGKASSKNGKAKARSAAGEGSNDAGDMAVKRLIAALKRLNPRAVVIPTRRCEVALTDVLNTGRFDMEQASMAPGWLQSIRGDTPHTPETEEYGVSSFVYRARRPFHPGRLYNDFLKKYFLTRVVDTRPGGEEEEEEEEQSEGKEESDGSDAEDEVSSGSGNDSDGVVEEEEGSDEEEGEGGAREGLQHYEEQRKECVEAQKRGLGGLVLRTKGFAWLATRNDSAVEWGAAGVVMQLSSGGQWFCTVPETEWPEDPSAIAQIRADFDSDPSIGDRRQEIVFIGQDMDVEAVTKLLDACLATEEEVLAAATGQLPDPLFGEDAEDDDDGEGSGDDSDGGHE